MDSSKFTISEAEDLYIFIDRYIFAEKRPDGSLKCFGFWDEAGLDEGCVPSAHAARAEAIDYWRSYLEGSGW